MSKEFRGLTEELCAQALGLILPAITACMETGVFNRQQGHLIVLDPTVPWDPKYQQPDDMHDGAVLFNYVFGDIAQWQHAFHWVARAKAFASWKTGLPSHRIAQEAPYLMQEGWTKYGGSAVGEGGLVVAFSGVQWYFDQFIAEMMLAAIKAVTLHAMHDKETGVMNDPDIVFLGSSS